MNHITHICHNLRFYPNAALETFRIQKAIHSKAIVVSEKGKDELLYEDWKDMVIFGLYGEEIVQKVKELIGMTRHDRHKLCKKKYEVFRNKIKENDSICKILNQDLSKVLNNSKLKK